MSWIVLNEEKGKIKLISKSSVDGILPKGSYLTINNGKTKHILRVDDTYQYNPYSPSPNIVELDLSGLGADQKTLNIVTAARVKDVSERNDGLYDYIKPQSTARLSNQEEINYALDSKDKGPQVMLATAQYGENKTLLDEDRMNLSVRLPEDMFYHQILISGKTGSGKTVAAKYLAQYFTEEIGGAVLAINVKDTDFLRLDQQTVTQDHSVRKEWSDLGLIPHSMNNFIVYYPATTSTKNLQNVNLENFYPLTFDVNTIDPDSIVGLLQNVTEIGSMSLPNIFRYWNLKKNATGSLKFSHFIRYFEEQKQAGCLFSTINRRGEESTVTLHRGTADNISRNLDGASEFFDNTGATHLRSHNILEPGKISVINVANQNGIVFGAILLRDLLKDLVAYKSENPKSTPIMIIIDEVHQFYNNSMSREALGDLDTICRTGRSSKIGIVFSSQNISDLPSGITSVINTKIIFRSEPKGVSNYIKVNTDELETMKTGYAYTNVYDMPNIRFIKFPLALAGV